MRSKLLNAALSFSLLLALLLSPVPVLADSSPPQSAPGLHPALESKAANSAVEQTYQVTLITGDVITVEVGPQGKKNIAISPGDSNEPTQHFLSFKQHGDTYVIPDGADLDKVDKELFNIDRLIHDRYYKKSSMPVLVSYTSKLSQDKVQSLIAESGISSQKAKRYKGLSILSTRLSGDEAAYKRLVSQSGIEKIWLDRRVHATLDESVPLIGTPSWWERGYDGKGIEIAILDTGIDSSHPALDDLDDNPDTNDPKVIRNVNFSDAPNFEDLFGHGTHVAGIAAGTAAGSNYKGVAPQAQLWNVKVLNEYGSGRASWVINGINFASLGPDGKPKTGDEADIINLSLGGGPTDGTDPVSQAVNKAVERGVIVVAAAGNEGPGLFTVSSPGVAEKAFTVGASDKEDELAEFSSRGPTLDFRVKPDVVAPGVDITSSVPTDPDCYLSDPSGYMSLSGTSMATPHAAGAAALFLDWANDIGLNLTSPAQFFKDTRINTAKELGYNVYEQGGGRLNLDTWGIDYSMSPATQSLGRFTSQNETASANFTFRSYLWPWVESTADHHIELTANLTDVINGTDLSGRVNLNPASFNISAGESKEIRMDVDLSDLPPSLYSGKVIATVDGGNSKPIHAIFGFARPLEVTVHKTDLNGNPAVGDPLWIFIMGGEDTVKDVMFKETDSSGNVTFSALPDTYHFVSYGEAEQNDISIWTVKENVTISQDTTIELDERNTRVIDFDPNKPGQIPSLKGSTLVLSTEKFSGSISSSWRYPDSFVTRVSPISYFDASFKYSYYPEEDFNSDNPELINTEEWHSLRYSLEEDLTDDVTFVADYDNLVHQNTRYSVALDSERAAWYNLSFDDLIYWDVSFGWYLDAPQQRWEWLSPEPVHYDREFLRDEPRGEWSFWGSRSVDEPDESKWGIGSHPLTSGVDIGIWESALHFRGTISEDPWGNEFENEYARWNELTPPGHITVIKDGETVLDQDVYDELWDVEDIPFSGSANFTVKLWGKTPLKLSTRSYAKYKFVAAPDKDSRSPRIWFVPPNIDSSGRVPAGNVKVAVQVQDESEIGSVDLRYSLDDGVTWKDAGSPAVDENGRYVFDLGELEEGDFVSLGVHAEDQSGNSIYRETIRGFKVNVSKAVTPGDANGDGVVNTLDITKVERIVAGVDPETPGADANQDGGINTLDITKVERIVAGLD